MHPLTDKSRLMNYWRFLRHIPAHWKSSQTTRRESSRRYLLAALHPALAAFEARANDGGSELDWEWLLERAEVHKVAALLSHRVEHSAARGALPDGVQDRLKEIRRTAMFAARRAQHTLCQVGAALEREGVPFLVLKGSYLGEHVYGNPAVRTSRDVDVLVPREFVFHADRVLKALGYRLHEHVPESMGFRPLPIEQPEPAEFRCNAHRFKEFLYIPPNLSVLPVDLHWDLCNPGTLRVDQAMVWSATTSANVAGMEIRTLDREAMLVYLATHAVDGYPSCLWLSHLADVAWFLWRYDRELRAERVRELAALWGVQTLLDRALQIVEEVLGVAISSPLAARPDRSGLRRVCFWVVCGTLVDEAYPRSLGYNRHWRQRYRNLLWRTALRMPTGHTVQDLTLFPVWRIVRERLPRPVLDHIRRSRSLRRIVGTLE